MIIKRKYDFIYKYNGIIDRIASLTKKEEDLKIQLEELKQPVFPMSPYDAWKFDEDKKLVGKIMHELKDTDDEIYHAKNEIENYKRELELGKYEIQWCSSISNHIREIKEQSYLTQDQLNAMANAQQNAAEQVGRMSVRNAHLQAALKGIKF